jgi:hypothetical protein
MISERLLWGNYYRCMMQNPEFKNLFFHDQESSPKETLKRVTQASEFGQQRTPDYESRVACICRQLTAMTKTIK